MEEPPNMPSIHPLFIQIGEQLKQVVVTAISILGHPLNNNKRIIEEVVYRLLTDEQYSEPNTTNADLQTIMSESYNLLLNGSIACDPIRFRYYINPPFYAISDTQAIDSNTSRRFTKIKVFLNLKLKMHLLTSIKTFAEINDAMLAILYLNNEERNTRCIKQVKVNIPSNLSRRDTLVVYVVIDQSNLTTDQANVIAGLLKEINNIAFTYNQATASQSSLLFSTSLPFAGIRHPTLSYVAIGIDGVISSYNEIIARAITCYISENPEITEVNVCKLAEYILRSFREAGVNENEIEFLYIILNQLDR